MRQMLLNTGLTRGRPFGRARNIVIHHTAGNLTLAQIRNILVNRRVAYHIAIDRNGDVGRFVNDGDRAWHAGDGIGNRSRGNDLGIGIAVANSGGAPNWPISGANFSVLVREVTAACRRLGITRLTLGQNLFAHRALRNTACPGNNLNGRMAELARLVNANLAPASPAAPAPFRLTTTLRRGAGPAAAVRQLQTRLNQLGMRDSNNRALAVDGVFGPRTEQAVLRFQRANVPAASRTGQVGPVTARALGWTWAG